MSNEKMIVRVVRMEFIPKKIAAFEQIFEESKDKIANASGCLKLQYFRDAANPNVRYTYSHWESEAALNAYRKSTLFGKVWPRTKALFAAKPQAFSMMAVR